LTVIVGADRSGEVVPAVADAYVRAGAWASSNFGSAPKLLAKQGISTSNTRRSYLRFDISGINEVGTATLRLHARVSNTATPRVQTTTYQAGNTSWDEHTVTWASKPIIGAPLGAVILSGTTPRWVEVDITAFVKAAKRAGHSSISVAMRNTIQTSASARFDSREIRRSAPHLVVTPDVR
jgi:endoglucanase